MTVATVTPAEEAFVSLVDHCIHCLSCKVDPDRPDTPPKCPEAERLYRAWFILWRKEIPGEDLREVRQADA